MPDTNDARGALHRAIALLNRHAMPGETWLSRETVAALRHELERALAACGETRRSRRAPAVEAPAVDKRSLRGRPVAGSPQWCPNRPRPRAGEAEPVVAEKP